MAGHTLMQLDTADPLETMRALEGVAGVQDVAVFGGGLHVTVDRARKSAVANPGGAVAGHRSERLERIEPSMEDVFVAMIEAEEREARDAGAETQ